MANNKRFTLIEIVVSIVIISIVAAIILVNVKDLRKNAVTSFVETNRSILQQAVDLYYLEHEDYPVINGLNIDLYNPQLLDTDKLAKEGYIKKDVDLGKIKEQYYWLDVFGTVWGATKPTVRDNLKLQSSNELTYTYNVSVSEEYQALNIYEVENYALETVASIKIKDLYADTSGLISGKKGEKIRYKKIKDLSVSSKEMIVFDFENPEKDYLISAVDGYNLEAVPVGAGYDPEGFRSIRGGNGEFDYILESDNMKYWKDFVTVQNTPGESKIEYKFAVKEDLKSDYGQWYDRFEDIPDGYGIKINVKMSRDDKGNKPDLLFLKVFYSLDKEVIEEEKEQIVFPTIEKLPNVIGVGGEISSGGSGSGGGRTLGGGSSSNEVDVNSGICGSNGTVSGFRNGTYYVVYRMYLGSEQGIESISTPNINAKVKSVVIRYSHNKKPYVTADSLAEIPSESCIEIIYKIPSSAHNDRDIFIYPSPPFVKVKNKSTLSKPRYVSLSNNPKVHKAGIPKKPNPADEELLDDNWITIDNLRIFQHGLNINTVWYDYEVEDTYVEGKSRILYRFSNGNGYYWSEEKTEFPENSTSNALLVHVYFQIHKDHYNDSSLVDPTLELMKIYSSDYPEGKVIPLNKPSVLIYPEKDNNLNRDTISTESNITWEAEVVDPKGLDIIEIEWSGDIQTKFEQVGKYTVKARAQNSNKVWSDWTSYVFEVKSEKPVANFKVDSTTGFAYLNEKTIFDTSLLFDPDGDEIIEYQWSNKQEAYTKEGYHSVSLRVKDSEGHWSNIVTKQIRVLDRNKDFWLIDNKTPEEIGYQNGFDSADDTSVTFLTGKVTWLKDIADKTIKVRLETTYKSNYYELSVNAVFKDVNGNVLSTHQTDSGTPITTLTSTRGAITYFVKVPKEAVSLEFTNNKSGNGTAQVKLYTVKLVNPEEVVNSPKNFSFESTGSSITFDWEKEENVEKVFFYQNGSLVGTSTGTTHTFSPLHVNTEYKYTVRSMSKNVLSEPIEISGKTKETFVEFYGAGAGAFDKDPNTSVTFNTANITWNRDLTGYTVQLIFDTTFRHNNVRAPAYAYVKDKDGNTLSVYTTGGAIYTTMSAPNSKQTYTFKMPEGAAYIEFKNSSAGSFYGTGSVKLFSVEVINETLEVNPPKNVTYIAGEYNVILNWETDEGVEKTFIYENGNAYRNTTTKTITFSPLQSGSTHTYELRSVKEGVLSDPTFVTVKLKEADVIFSGAAPAAFDKNPSTVATFTTGTVTWDKDISGQTLMIRMDTSYRSNYYTNPVHATFKDANGNILNSINTNGQLLSRITATKGIVQYYVRVPDGAARIDFTNSKNSNGSSDVKLYSLEIVNFNHDLKSPSQVESTAEETTALITWTNEIENVTTYVYRNGVLVGNSKTGSFNLTGLTSNTTYDIELVNFIDNKFSNKKTLSITTK